MSRTCTTSIHNITQRKCKIKYSKTMELGVSFQDKKTKLFGIVQSNEKCTVPKNLCQSLKTTSAFSVPFFIFMVILFFSLYHYEFYYTSSYSVLLRLSLLKLNESVLINWLRPCTCDLAGLRLLVLRATFSLYSWR